MAFIPPWKMKSRFDRWFTYSSWAVGLYSVLSVFIHGLPNLLWIFVPWVCIAIPYSIYELIQMNRLVKEAKEFTTQINVLDEALETFLREGHTDIGILPPELQEELKMRAAKNRLEDDD